MSKYIIDNLPDYFKQYEKSVHDPEKFWEQIADKNFIWNKKWDSVLEYDVHNAKIEWFKNAKLNITENCINRHLAENPDKIAIIWEPNSPDEEAIKLSYKELHERVAKE